MLSAISVWLLYLPTLACLFGALLNFNHVTVDDYFTILSLYHTCIKQLDGYVYNIGYCYGFLASTRIPENNFQYTSTHTLYTMGFLERLITCTILAQVKLWLNQCIFNCSNHIMLISSIALTILTCVIYFAAIWHYLVHHIGPYQKPWSTSIYRWKGPKQLFMSSQSFS